jgi:hypothetical protein
VTDLPERTPLNVVLARSHWALIAARSWVMSSGHASLEIVVVWRPGLERKTKRGRIGLPWHPHFVDSDAEMLKLGILTTDGRFLIVPNDIKPQHRKVPWREPASILAIPLPVASLDGITFACGWRMANIPFKAVDLGALPKPRKTSAAPKSSPDLEPGALLPLNQRVVRNDRAEVWLTSLVAQSSGFALGVMRQVKDGSDLDLHVLPVQYLQGGPTGDVFRFGVEYASGARATNVDEQCHIRRRSAKLEVVFRDYPENSATEVAWCTPVPRSGSVAFVCEWPAAGIALTRHQLDGAAIRQAAALSTRLARG